MNQTEIKDMYFEYVINVSRQVNNAKMKLNLKINLQIVVLIFCEINDNTPGPCLVLLRRIHNPVKQII